MQKVTSRDGTPIAYDQTGAGPPVILVSGAFGYRAFPKLVQLADLLAEHFTVLSYDRRGRGDSGDTAPFAVEREIEDLEALIGAAGGRTSLWGWSSGAVLALRAAAHGLPIDRVAAHEPPFLVDDSRPLPAGHFAARLDGLLAAGRRGAAVRYFMTEGMGVPGLLVRLMRLTPMWSRLERVAHTLPYDWAVLRNTMQGRPLAREEWVRVTVPVLVLAGARSPAQLRNAARAIADVLPDGRHVELPRQSHNVSMKALAPVLVEFLAGAKAAPAAVYRIAGAGA